MIEGWSTQFFKIVFNIEFQRLEGDTTNIREASRQFPFCPSGTPAVENCYKKCKKQSNCQAELVYYHTDQENIAKCRRATPGHIGKSDACVKIANNNALMNDKECVLFLCSFRNCSRKFLVLGMRLLQSSFDRLSNCSVTFLDNGLKLGQSQEFMFPGASMPLFWVFHYRNLISTEITSSLGSLNLAFWYTISIDRFQLNFGK